MRAADRHVVHVLEDDGDSPDGERVPAAMPKRPIFSLADAELDAIPEWLDVRTPQLFRAGKMRAVVDPRRLEFGVPTRGDLMVLQLLKDNLGTRPFYIARTSGRYVQALGLEPYALMQGLAYKIEPAAIASSADTIAVPGIGHLDVRRTQAIWNVFGAPRAFVARGDWVDRPSIAIPALYISTAFQLAQVMLERRDTVRAERFRRAALDMGEATHSLDLFLPRAAAEGPPPGGDTLRARAVPVQP